MVKNSFLLKVDTSKDTSQNPNHFTIEYNHFDLDAESNYEMALVRASMYYSWYNVSSSFSNNQFTVYNGVSDTTYTIPNGFYSVSDLNTQIQTLANTTNIAIVPNFNTHRVTITIAGGFQLKLTNHSGFASLLGFGAVDITSTTTSTQPADITRGINSLMIRTNIVEPNSLENNIQSQILQSFVPNVNPGSLLNLEPKERLYLPIRPNSNHIHDITLDLTDNLNRRIELNGEHITYLLHIRKR